MKYIRKLLFVISIFSIVFYIPNVYAMQVFVKKTDGKNITIEVESSDTIEAVKEKIFTADNTIQKEKIQLVFNGKVLEDGRSLADYEITKESTITLTYIEDITTPDEEENPNTSDNIISSILLLITSIFTLSILNVYTMRTNYEK